MLLKDELSIRKCSSADNYFNDDSLTLRHDKDLYLLSDINEESSEQSRSSIAFESQGHKPSINDDDARNTLKNLLS